MPTDYALRFEAARRLDTKLADLYVAHSVIGDPLADAAVEELAAYSRAEATRYVEAMMEHSDNAAARNAPPTLKALFEELETPPDWVDLASFNPGIRMFHRNSKLVLGAFVGGVLVEGFATNISKAFFITGRLRDQGVRRLRQNNRQMVEMFMPGGLEPYGDGWKLSVRVRLVHAQVRRLLAASDQWDREAWGEPVSAAHTGFAICAFSAMLIRHLKELGASFDEEERASFMQVWRYSGHLMGIPETILFRDEAEALRLFEIGRLCEPPPGYQATSMANALINSAPLVAGVEGAEARRSLAKYVYSISRALIGNPLADALKYPPSSTFGVLLWFRFQAKFERVLDKIIPRAVRNRNFANFTSLLEVSMFDETGISYRMPDHVFAEESSRW